MALEYALLGRVKDFKEDIAPARAFMHVEELLSYYQEGHFSKEVDPNLFLLFADSLTNKEEIVHRFAIIQVNK